MRLIIMFLILVLCIIKSNAQQFYLFTGSYTTRANKGEGIGVLQFDASNGSIKSVHKIAVVNPSYLTVSATGKNIYAVSEQDAGKVGEVSALKFDQQKGELNLINKQTAGGISPCYVAVNKQMNWLITANYSSGDISVFRLKGDGSIDTLNQLLPHKGSSVNKQRQQSAHAHAVIFSPDDKYVFAADLGADKIYQYAFSPLKQHPLTLVDSIGTSKPGNGPRHLTFHPNGKYLYAINELTGTIDVFNYRKNGTNLIQTIATDSSKNRFAGSADIHFSPDGRFIYASNRGEVNSIAVYKVNAGSGKLSLVEYVSSLIATPRNFAIDPTGNYLLVANQSANNIAVFKRDKATGKLSFTGKTFETGTPVCLKFLHKE